jgi:hypothetical protein
MSTAICCCARTGKGRVGRHSALNCGLTLGCTPRRVRAFPRKRPNGGVRRGGWRCATTPTASSWSHELPFGQAHHIQHWAQGGPTTLRIVLLPPASSRGSRKGFQVKRLDNSARSSARLVTRCRMSRRLRTPTTRRQGSGQEYRRGEYRSTRTATPGWYGESLDVGWAIDVLHPDRPSLTRVETGCRPQIVCFRCSIFSGCRLDLDDDRIGRAHGFLSLLQRPVSVSWPRRPG